VSTPATSNTGSQYGFQQPVAYAPPEYTPAQPPQPAAKKPGRAALIVSWAVAGISVVALVVAFSTTYGFGWLMKTNGYVTGQPHTLASGDTGLYTGNLAGGQAQDPNGKFDSDNGSVCTGGFKDNNLNGTVNCTWANGSTYVGGYKDGKNDGEGTYTSSDGSKYVGEYKNGQREGHGTETQANGDTCDGSYKANRLDGHVTCHWVTGDTYDGEYKAGYKDGRGTYTWFNVSTYEGEWKTGLPEGQGTMKWNDGTSYVGQWQAGMRNGDGTSYNADGTVAKTGKWVNNHFVG